MAGVSCNTLRDLFDVLVEDWNQLNHNAISHTKVPELYIYLYIETYFVSCILEFTQL
jgi:hypothetical protein